MEKIVITGGLGYIGTELCKLYSGETRYKNIIVTDKRFVSERVKQLRDWGFDFRQGDILNKEFISKLVKDADIVYHFAGITDVAYTKLEEKFGQNELIEKVGIEGSRNIINNVSGKCKLIFPSTHVVYEGFDKTVYDVKETEPTTPILTYSKGKDTTEKDLLKSNLNYIILRLASVYGYSTDTMRVGIMPNLFSKIASQDGIIKLFSGGVQLKSLVPLVDVARCFKFMAERKDIKRETFHLSKENMTVKEVAELCKKIKPSLELIETNDEIPNLGYTISNEKLLSTGFKFRYSLEQCLKEMINNWSKQEIRPELEYTVQGGKEYIDERGKISNYELTEPINLIGYIESKKGTVRANHYHPIQEQKCLLIKGKYVSVIKDLSNPKAQIHTQLIQEGDIAVIKPNVAHTMVFLEDSIFLNLVRGEREHENYGVTHTIPYKLVNERFRKEIISNYSSIDRAGKKGKLRPVISLGMSPLANNLLDSQDQPDELYPLEMMYCPESHNCQLSYIVPAKKMFDHYLYVSSTAKSFRDHFKKAANDYINDFKLNTNSFIVDIGSNDGIALLPFKEKGIKVLGIEPAKNICKIANEKGINTINSYFNNTVAEDIIKNHGNADIIMASNVFAHSDKLEEIAKSAFKILKDDGVFIVEVQYLLDTIKDLTFDNIYHEHVNYWSVTSLNNFFSRLGLFITNIDHVDTHGGSIRVYVQRHMNPAYMNSKSNLEEYLQNEKNEGLTDYTTYLEFASRIEEAKINVVNNIKNLKDKGLTLVGYGSPAKATTSLNYYGITSEEITYIIEDNPLKHNKTLPGVRIPIFSKEKTREIFPDVIIVMAWNFIKEIKNNNKDLIDKGVRFISIKDLQNPKLI
jgi:nucleoside-diphosphate-sugar epimerase/SAM-dependent methyltransferase/quercetin dioxygenase-like cupin family protein